MTDNEYKPLVPKWVGEVLEKQRKQDVFATLGHSKEWEKWKRKYSRKLKYARQNGWIVEED